MCRAASVPPSLGLCFLFLRGLPTGSCPRKSCKLSQSSFSANQTAQSLRRNCFFALYSHTGIYARSARAHSSAAAVRVRVRISTRVFCCCWWRPTTAPSGRQPAEGRPTQSYPQLNRASSLTHAPSQPCPRPATAKGGHGGTTPSPPGVAPTWDSRAGGAIRPHRVRGRRR